MRPNNDIQLSRRAAGSQLSSAAHAATARAAFWLILCAAFVIPSLVASDYAAAQAITKNQWVGARVEDSFGYVTIYKGDPANNESLSFRNMSFLTVKVQGSYYTNDPYATQIGPGCNTPATSVFLGNANTFSIGDTIRCVWPENGFDIVQNVYPVEFTKSGVIVLSIKIVNHSGSPMSAQAQFLLDNLNSNLKPGGGTDSSNDNPYFIDRYGALTIGKWKNCAPNPIPSFYLGLEFPFSSARLGAVGIGYVNDTFPPLPLGLMPLTFMEFGDWHIQGNYLWGQPCSNDQANNAVTDEATLMMGPGLTANADYDGATTEIFRTAYGTPEWCYNHGSIFGFALYPHHVYWDPLTQKYTPNPIQIETFLYNVDPGTAGGTTIRQTVGNPIVITSPKPVGLQTTQMQSVGSINTDNFADIRWTDSVLVLPGGCAKSFPVDIRFDVRAVGVTTPIFRPDSIWDCTIDVECAHPDTLPPEFRNSFAGCDSILYDTITVQEADLYDQGLDSITYSSPDLSPGQYSVSIASPSFYNCSKNPVKIYVQQIDTSKKGHVIFRFADCANNISTDEICFTAHPPLPDITAPQFWDSAAADCHALCRQLKVTDSIHSSTSIDRGIDVLDTVSNTNMTLTGAGSFKPGTSEATIRICVTDSMQYGKIVLRATDTARNVRLDTVTYCTTADIKAPIITYDPITAAGSWPIHVTDIQAWDRGVDTVWIDQDANVVTIPSPILYPIGCKPTYDFVIHIVDTTKCARATIHARDCANNLAVTVLVAYTKGAKPGIVASKTVLCGGDSIVLTATGNFASWLWSTGETKNPIIVRSAGQYSVTGDDGEGCKSTSDPITITSSPATPVITPPGPITMCEPATAPLDAGNNGYVSYQWLKGGVTIPGATLQTYVANASGAYTVQVTNDSGCSGTSPAVSVTINPLPAKPVITAANNVLTASSVGVTYQWSLDGTPIPGATSQSYTALTGGNFTVTIDSNNCTSTSLPYSNAGSTLIALPAMVVAHESDHITLPLSIVTSQSFAAGSHRPFTVTLSYNKTLLVPDPSDPNFTIGVPGTVKYSSTTDSAHGVIANLPFIAALGTDSCTTVKIVAFSWSTSTNISVTTQDGNFCLIGLCTQGGTRYLDPEGKVLLSEARPNPAFDNIQIDYQIIERGPTTLVISDLLGREVLRLVDADQQPGTYSVAADVSSLPTGTYVYSLRTPTTVKSNHLQITR